MEDDRQRPAPTPGVPAVAVALTLRGHVAHLQKLPGASPGMDGEEQAAPDGAQHGFQAAGLVQAAAQVPARRGVIEIRARRFGDFRAQAGGERPGVLAEDGGEFPGFQAAQRGGFQFDESDLRGVHIHGADPAILSPGRGVGEQRQSRAAAGGDDAGAARPGRFPEQRNLRPRVLADLAEDDARHRPARRPSRPARQNSRSPGWSAGFIGGSG